MSKFDENLFGRIAILNEYVTKPQLEECLELQRTGVDRKHIGQILLHHGYLTDDQLNRILEIRNRKVRKLLWNQNDGSEIDRAFARVVLQEFLVGLDDLEDAVLEQQRLRQFNLYFSLLEVLVSKQRVTVKTVKRILARQGRSILRCAVCDVQYQVAEFEEEEPFSCPKCESQLGPPAFLDPLMVEGIIGAEGIDARGQVNKSTTT